MCSSSLHDTPTPTHTPPHTHTCINARGDQESRACVRTSAHTHTHTHSHAHNRTQSYTRTCIPVVPALAMHSNRWLALGPWLRYSHQPRAPEACTHTHAHRAHRRQSLSIVYAVDTTPTKSGRKVIMKRVSVHPSVSVFVCVCVCVCVCVSMENVPDFRVSSLGPCPGAGRILHRRGQNGAAVSELQF